MWYSLLLGGDGEELEGMVVQERGPKGSET